MSRRITTFRAAALALGFGFLYLPIALLIAYSFNASRLVAVWGGWSLYWYGELVRDDKFRGAAWNSLRIGVMAASLALVLGTCAGFAIERFTRFRGRLVFSFMLMAPLVVPEVILGLSLLLLFVASPMAVYSSVRIGVTPEINALATVFLAVVVMLVALAFSLIARQERRRLAAS